MATSQLDDIEKEFNTALLSTSSISEVQNLKSEYLGKKGRITEILSSLRNLPAEERRATGARANAVRQQIESTCKERVTELETAALDVALQDEWHDISLRRSRFDHGIDAAGTHPLTQVYRELEDVFLAMGFSIMDGPHIEDDWHNFEALNIPPHHPARDMQDTFWLQEDGYLLRTHTSNIQIRGMQGSAPPFRFIGPGDVFRCERTDASHEMCFGQLEGLLVDRGVSVSHLLYFAKKLFSEIFHEEIAIRTRPSYFPFVEPGLEIDMSCTVCKGAGCSVCKHVGWVEMLGCGLIHPNVLKAVGVDPNEFSGFAFGLGVDRFMMMKHSIDDIRHLRSGDLRFVSQFKSF